MADQKITELDAVASLATSDLFVMVDVDDDAMSESGTNKSITTEDLFRSVPAGSVEAPGLAFAGDSDTGLFSSAANMVAFAAGGVEGLRVVTSAGVATAYIGQPAAAISARLAIATSNTQAGLLVSQATGGTSSHYIDCRDRFGTQHFHVDNTGLVYCTGIRGVTGFAFGDSINVHERPSFILNQNADSRTLGIVSGNTNQTKEQFSIWQDTSTSIHGEMSFGVLSNWVDSTHASRKARASFRVYDTVAREALRIEASGSEALVGFLGATAVARQAIGAAATDEASAITLVNSIRTALINLGLCSA